MGGRVGRLGWSIPFSDPVRASPSLSSVDVQVFQEVIFGCPDVDVQM